MATSQEFSEEQLTAARKPLWHQAGEPVLTQEAARDFIEGFGLVAFAPGRLQMAAPSLVEATLGAEKDAPSAADAQVARDLVSRLVADGAALPLNLLGGPGDTPDFVVAVGAFRYIFTLRGDKSWKQAPSTSGAVKVSPLALRVFETLTEKGALTAAELANELGREVTEAAITRSLNELWQMLRVIPLLAQGENPTLWELTTRRFTKHIKAGVNAGQPTALSALVSLYLQQSLAATTDEIETFLSPIAARSRVREVLHALVAARELSEVVVAGKTLLHVAGELPEFAPLPEPEVAEPVEGEAVVAVAKPRREFSETETAEPGRIRRFGGEAPRTREGGKVAFKREGASAFARKPREGRAAFGGPREEGERRPFRPREDRGAEYRKPWDEERPARRPRAEAGEEGERTERPKRSYGDRKPAFGGDRPKRAYGAGDRERRPFTRREEGEGTGERKPFRAGKPFGERKPFGDRERKPFGDRERKPFGDRERKPFRPREEGEGGGERRPFRPRTEGGERPARAPRAFGGGDRERKPFRRSEEGGERPARAPRAFGGGDRERKPFRRREEGEGGGERRPFRPRTEGGERPARAPRAFGGGDRERKPFKRREEGEGGGERRPFRPREEGGERRPARKPFGAKPFGAKPAGKFGGKPGGGRPGGFKAGGPKAGGFKGKPGGGKFGGGKPGGFKPTTRKPKRETEE